MELHQYGKEYLAFLSDIKDQIRNAQYRAMVKVNHELLLSYWHIGKRIIEAQNNSGWGDDVVERLAKDLKNEYPNMSGYSRRNLFYMKKFALENDNLALVQTVTALISWSHNILLLERCKDQRQRLWYAQKSIENGWSVRVLDYHIDRQEYEKSGKGISNFATTLSSPQSDLAQSILKDPYNFDFLNLTQKATEKELEDALVNHITTFLLELGKGFAFVGRQYVVTVEDTDYKIDLLFYHLKLRCYVVIELKTTDFQPEYIGKLNFYINVVNAQVKNKSDKPTIGMLLCKNKEKGGAVTVEFALQNVKAPINVSSYTLLKESLPAIEMLEQELKRVRFGE
jgi:predicted nuclease of restriction endonuclease-like (RecB) superfamily